MSASNIYLYVNYVLKHPMPKATALHTASAACSIESTCFNLRSITTQAQRNQLLPVKWTRGLVSINYDSIWLREENYIVFLHY